MMRCLFIFGCLLSQSAENSELDALKEKIILETINAQKLTKKLLDWKHLVKAHYQCEFQLQQKQVPTECFRTLSIKKDLGLLSIHEFEVKFQKLDQICIKSLEKIDPMDLDLRAKVVGNRCQEALQKKIKQKIYIQEDIAPQEFIL